MTVPILAIDLGKFKSTACVYRGADGEFAVESFVTEREGLRRLLAKHRPGASSPPFPCSVGALPPGSARKGGLTMNFKSDVDDGPFALREDPAMTDQFT